jgi:hypothetical protein
MPCASIAIFGEWVIPLEPLMLVAKGLSCDGCNVLLDLCNQPVKLLVRQALNAIPVYVKTDR